MRIPLVTLLLGLALPLQAQVLATVDGIPITERQLQKTLQSSPFATRYPSLDADAQADLRRDLLQRLVQAEVLHQEALRLGLDREADFRRAVARFERGLLAQKYLQTLRDRIAVPKSLEDEWRRKLGKDPDALAAVRSIYVARRYQAARDAALARLRARFGDVGETELLARGAREAGIDVAAQVAGFRRERLIQYLLEKKEKEWIPDTATLRAYYQSHPEIGRIPERRHVAQIVVADRELAESLRRRLLAGESLFRLARVYSIDPYGRKNAGDLGWLPEGSAMPAIEKALATLKDGEISPVIETPRGFHLVTIVERQPAEQKPFAAVQDRVRRALVLERLPAYVESLMARHRIAWSGKRR